MSRLLVIEILSGSVVGVSFDTGEQLDVSVAVVDHNDKRVYRIGEANDGGGEEILASVKRGDCDDGYACDSHNYTFQHHLFRLTPPYRLPLTTSITSQPTHHTPKQT